MHNTRWSPAIALGAVVLAAWLLVGGGLDSLLRPFVGPQRQAGEGPAAELDRQAPDFTAAAVGGEERRLVDLRGQVVLLNFWATWCAPCRLEMPELEQAYRAYRDRGFTVVALNLRETPDEVRAFFRELGLTFPSWLDRGGAITELYRVRGLPTTVVIDRGGLIRYVRVGPVDRKIIEERVVPLL